MPIYGNKIATMSTALTIRQALFYASIYAYDVGIIIIISFYQMRQLGHRGKMTFPRSNSW